MEEGADPDFGADGPRTFIAVPSRFARHGCDADRSIF
jgi:hypothetical protein